jgi:hypothetical protein
MDLVDQILNQARNILFCPICNSHYQMNEIRFRGFIDNTYIFQAYCQKGHEPLAVTYLASLQKLEKPISAHFHQLSGEKISKEIMEKAEKYFSTFNGDFGKIA